MIVSTIVVEVHEKRNHPHEYGHRDCSIRIEAGLDEGEDAESVITRLRGKAQKHVDLELDAWVAKVHLAHLKNNAPPGF